MAMANPKHPDMLVIDLGMERKVKLQAGSEAERDAWVIAIEAAKLRAWSRQEENAYNQVVEDARRGDDGSASSAHGRGQSPAHPSSSPFAGSDVSSRQMVAQPSPASSIQFDAEALRTPHRKQPGCCVIS